MTGPSHLDNTLPLWFFPGIRANRYVSIADRHRARRDWPQAAAYYRQAVQAAPARRPIWIQLGHALKEAGDTDGALDAYRRASTLPGDDGDAPLHLGLLAKQLGHMSLATAALARALREHPGQADARRELQALLGSQTDLDLYLLDKIDETSFNPAPQGHLPDGGHRETRGSSAPPESGPVRQVIVKELALSPGQEAALMVTHAPAGRLKPHVLPYARQLQGTGLKVLLVVVVDRPLELLEAEMAGLDGIIVRDNGGYDFGAWADGFRLCPALLGAGLLVMTNDSIIPTADTGVFGAMMDRVRACPADIVGLTASHEYGWHVQSYFLAFRPGALSSWSFQHFIRDIRHFNDKDTVIRTYEVPFAARMRAAGLTVRTLYSGSYSHNPTFFSWRELIEQGFPFIKLLILRKSFEAVAPYPEVIEDLHAHWPEVTGKAGFDVDLIRKAVRAADLASVPAGNDHGLLVDPRPGDRIATGNRLRVAYIGPWNYDNGLGSASRDLLNTLRHTDARLNVYPIAKPFHIHRLICPAVETLDFGGAPDVAIVHLNPDSWHLLTDEQHAIIASAKRRIGYWVWETDRLPPSWHQNLHAVDRIWAPSTYCADVFQAATGIPVDVVPHPVRIPARIPATRDTVLRGFGIDPAHKIILYVFDGASYLVRKNPQALIRAFGASGLADRGWDLVLKTKHLYDRPETGKDLADLVAQTPGARLLEVSLQSDEVRSLLAAADIYASPHCSEGFGLTVAEAMALGKPVVATDYSGTRDFLQADRGYPVAAGLWTLEEDHGHYLAGHTWGRIDEAALTATLIRAARAIEEGDHSIGNAAREAIGRMLSYEAVADHIKASLAALTDDAAPAAAEAMAPLHASPARPGLTPPEPPHYRLNLSPGTALARLAPIEGLIPVPLEPDLSWDGRIPAGDDPQDWLLLAPRDAIIAPGIRHLVQSAAAARPDVTLFYADDVAVEADPLDTIRLKPEFDRTLLVASDYIGAPVLLRRKTLTSIGGLDAARGNAVLYDLVLRVAEAGGTIGRIPHVLVAHPGKRPFADLQTRREALAARSGFADVELLNGPTPGLLRQRLSREAELPVSIIIPTRRTRSPLSSQTYVESLLEGIARADWPMDRLTVIVGDDIPGEADWAARPWPFTLRRVETPRAPGEAFNYAAKMNHLWRLSRDEQIIFMNDDAQPENPDWLRALLTFARDETVGGVGARLYYEDGSIQHAGMVPAMRTVAHAWLNWPAAAPTYQDWAITQREWSMVTGAIFATRRSVLDQINGFDEQFSLEFNDVDLCLRIRNLGYRIVYNPDAEFTHAEKASRGERLPPGQEVALFLSRWSQWLEVDPSWHPSLAKNRLDPAPSPSPGVWYL